MKKKKQRRKQRIRTEQRRQARQRKRAGRVRTPTSASGPQYVTMSTWFGEPHPEDDNCPFCRAQRELGIVDGEPMDQKTYEAYKSRVDEIIAAEGMPEDAVVMTGEQLQRRFDWIEARLREQGRSVDLEQLNAMPDHEFAEHMELVSQLGQAYNRLN